MDQVTWAALALTLTLLGGAWTFLTWRRRGPAYALRPAGLTLLPVALYLTRTLRLVGEIGSAVSRWATSLVLSPTVWLGVIVGAVALALLAASGPVRRRAAGGRAPGPARAPAAPARTASRAAAPPLDPDLAEIEELLRRRGID